MSLELSIEHAASRQPPSALTSPAGVAQLFAPLVADSPALVWIKDLEGRYLHVNPRHAEQLGVDELRIRGLTDADLRPSQVTDGDRPIGNKATAPEELEAEYTIEAHRDRPALAAWRFLIHGTSGEPLAICGVAAPVSDAAVARRERDRLVELDRAPERPDRHLWRGDPREPGIDSALSDEVAESPSSDESPNDHERSEADQLGASLVAAGERVHQLEQLLVDARAPFEELSALLEDARHAQAVAVQSTARVAQLEERLEEILAELEVVRKAHARDAVALSAESQLRSEWEARAEEALGRVADLESSLAEVRARNYQLENTVAHAEVSVATSAQEANSARLRAEAARLDAEAARLEAQAYRQDVETAKLAAESSRHDVELAQQEANRFRLAAEAAFEKMHAVRGEWETAQDTVPDTGDSPSREESDGEHVSSQSRDETAEPMPEPSGVNAGWEVADGQEPTGDDDDREELLEAPLVVAEQPEAEPDELFVLDEQEAEAEEPIAVADEQAEEAVEPIAVADEQEAEEAGESIAVADQQEAEAEDEHAEAVADERAAPETETGELAEPTAARISSPLTWTTSAKLSLTAALVDCNSSRTVFAEAVRVIGSRGGWDSVIAWTVDARAKRYAVTAMWCATDEMAPFEADIRQLRQDMTESALGRVAAEGAISWFSDPGAGGDANLERAAAEGMNLVVILPVLHDGETVAVLELCSRHAGEPDEALRTALEAMASELIFVQQLLSASESPRWPVWRRR